MMVALALAWASLMGSSPVTGEPSKAEPAAAEATMVRADSIVGTWACNGDGVVRSIWSFKADGTFSAPLTGESGRWRVFARAPGVDALEISHEGGTVVLHLGPVKSETLKITKVEWSPSDAKDAAPFLCYNGEDSRVYDTIARSAPIHGSVRRALIGDWGSSTGLELRADGTFYEGEEFCNEGTWRYGERTLTLTYNDQTCAPRRLKVTITSHVLTLESDKPSSEPWTLLRRVDSHTWVATPASRSSR